MDFVIWKECQIFVSVQCCDFLCDVRYLSIANVELVLLLYIWFAVSTIQCVSTCWVDYVLLRTCLALYSTTGE